MKGNDLFPGTVSSSGKRIELNGRFYRMRRGKLVEIPPQWVGETLHAQTKRKRPSKSRAIKKQPRNLLKKSGADWRGWREARHMEV